MSETVYNCLYGGCGTKIELPKDYVPGEIVRCLDCGTPHEITPDYKLKLIEDTIRE